MNFSSPRKHFLNFLGSLRQKKRRKLHMLGYCKIHLKNMDAENFEDQPFRHGRNFKHEDILTRILLKRTGPIVNLQKNSTFYRSFQNSKFFEFSKVFEAKKSNSTWANFENSNKVNMKFQKFKGQVTTLCHKFSIEWILSGYPPKERSLINHWPQTWIMGLFWLCCIEHCLSKWHVA